MACLTKSELIFFILNEFQNAEEHIHTQNHLNICPKCREKLHVLEKEVTQMNERNEKECKLIREHLLDYAEGKCTNIAGIDMAEHLEECTNCNFIYEQLQKKLTLQETEPLNIPIPDRLTKNIQQLLNKKSMDLKTQIKPVKALKSKLYALMDRIELFVVPTPAPEFLSNTIITGDAEIEFFDKDVAVDVGATGRKVKLFSLENLELDCQISNQDGIVVFKDFLPDKYKIIVDGFEIKEVHCMK